jgi:ribonuclease HI
MAEGKGLSMDTNELYCDGGCITPNPSNVGGTWAFRLLKNGVVTCERSGVITQPESRMETVSNNLTEMLALVRGLESLDQYWFGTVFSDSQITLGRAFLGWKWNNIPEWLLIEFNAARDRLINYKHIQHVLLQGHPTRKELSAGFGSRGYPVSPHNVWCDQACNEQARKFLETVKA